MLLKACQKLRFWRQSGELCSSKTPVYQSGSLFLPGEEVAFPRFVVNSELSIFQITKK